MPLEVCLHQGICYDLQAPWWWVLTKKLGLAPPPFLPKIGFFSCCAFPKSTTWKSTTWKTWHQKSMTLRIGPLVVKNSVWFQVTLFRSYFWLYFSNWRCEKFFGRYLGGGLQPGGITLHSLLSTLHSPPGGQTVSKLQIFNQINQIMTMLVCVCVAVDEIAEIELGQLVVCVYVMESGCPEAED